MEAYRYVKKGGTEMRREYECSQAASLIIRVSRGKRSHEKVKKRFIEFHGSIFFLEQ